MFGSRMENAKKFKRWVTKEVLPSIRETGSYTVKIEVDDVQFENERNPIQRICSFDGTR